MSIRSFLARHAMKAIAVAVFAWAGSTASASDPYISPGAGPVAVGAPGCETCQHGAARSSCTTCKPSLLFPKRNQPYPVNLCPGACFGYFQTQWRKWDEACPYPYVGQGLSDAPKPPIPVVNVPRPGAGELNPPRPLDPMKDIKRPEEKKSGFDVPPIPGGKFN